MIDALSPVRIGRVELKNRVVFPSICTFFCNPDGTVSESFHAYVRSLAAGGIGLIVLPGNPHPKNTAGRPSIAGDENIVDWKMLADTAHQYGAKLFCQLHPVGVTDSDGNPVNDPRDFSQALIDSLVHSYGDAAVRLQKAGVDGVEIQSCHERYIADFLSERSNHRTDGYGKDVSGRSRMAREILQDIKSKCPGYPVVFKLSSSEAVKGGRELPETVAIAKILEKEGADAITVSIGMTESEEIKCAPMDMADCLNMYSAKAMRDELHIPVIMVDRVVTIPEANDMISSGKADLVAMGRAHLADPALVNKHLGVNPAPPVMCVGCNQGCRMGAVGDRKMIRCMQNPQLGRLDKLVFKSAGEALRQKKIVVIGAGPAGLEAACRLAECGLKPEVYEKEARPGGLANLAAIPPHKENMARVVSCRVAYLEQRHVPIHYGEAYTLEKALSERPDFLFAATGGKPLIPKLPGIDGPGVVSGDDVLRGNAPDGKRIAVLGGGLIGCETAEYLATYRHKDVEIMEMREDVAIDLVKSRRSFMLKRMSDLGIKLHVNVKVKELALPDILVEDASGVTALHGFDGVVVAFGRRAERGLIDQLAQSGFGGKVYEIGDAQKPSFAIDAISGAAERVADFMKENDE